MVKGFEIKTETKISTDISTIVEVLRDIGAELKKLSDLPEKERESYKKALKDTYSMLDAVLLMIIRRLGNILFLLDDPNDSNAENRQKNFIAEVLKLGDYNEWRAAERNFRMCNGLVEMRVQVMNRMNSKFWKVIHFRNNWEKLVNHINSMLYNEDAVAQYLRNEFENLSDQARGNSPDITAIQSKVKELKKSLDEIRDQLIKNEIEFSSIWIAS